MSVSELDKTGFEVRFKFEKLIVGRNRRVYIRGDKLDGMYCIAIYDDNKIINCFSML